MKVTEIYYPTPLDSVADKYNDNLDVIITLEGYEPFCVVVATPDNLKRQIENSGKRYLPIGLPEIIVSCLEEDIIKEAIEAYTDEFPIFKKYYIMSAE